MTQIKFDPSFNTKEQWIFDKIKRCVIEIKIYYDFGFGKIYPLSKMGNFQDNPSEKVLAKCSRDRKALSR